MKIYTITLKRFRASQILITQKCNINYCFPPIIFIDSFDIFKSTLYFKGWNFRKVWTKFNWNWYKKTRELKLLCEINVQYFRKGFIVVVLFNEYLGYRMTVMYSIVTNLSCCMTFKKSFIPSFHFNDGKEKLAYTNTY